MTFRPTNAAEPTQSLNHNPNEPLPRPKRQRRRDKADRGLPPDEELQRLAAEYLRVQRRHWPKLVNAGLLPDIADDIVTTMVENFKNRHRTSQVDPAPLRAFLKHCPKLGGDYNRYSCDNSSPKSIIDQMVNGLDKARQEERFVPWQYIFADYSVSGLNASRHGYSSYKAVLQSRDHFIETTYIDDFTRASRDELEWWRLAYLSRRLQKRMIGASDGFDLFAPNGETMIAIYGLVSRLFIKGQREKVKRGMRGAARRGTVLGKLALGFTRTVRQDERGNVVRDKDGIPEYVPCIDPATRDARKLLYELFVVKCWSAYKITKHFNALSVDGWNGWTEAGIKKLLRSATAIGVFIWNRTRREYDHQEERWVVVPNPRAEWVVHYNPALAIVPMDWWKAARKKLSGMRRESPLTGRKQSRNEKSATTLFSGTLFCDYCGREIMLMRSAGKYKVMGCLHGPTGKLNCKLSTSKSARIIEKCLLDFIREHLFTEQGVTDLVAAANRYLIEEARKPRVDTAPLKASIRNKETSIKKLFQRIVGCADVALNEAYDKQISELQREVNNLKIQLRAAEVQNEPPPAPLDLAAVKTLLPDLDALLKQEIPAAAEAIRTLTGRITIKQEKVPGKERGANWIATFSSDLLAWLRQRSRAANCPESITLEYLSTRNWIMSRPCEVRVRHIPKHERVADRVSMMRANGASIEAIARCIGETTQTVKDGLTYASTGRRPKTKPHGRRTGTRSGMPKYKFIAQEVVRLRDENYSFVLIAKSLHVSNSTVQRAYDHLRPSAVREAVANGTRPTRGAFRHVAQTKFERIEEMIRQGKPAGEIAEKVDCGINTVYREKERLGL